MSEKTKEVMLAGGPFGGRIVTLGENVGYLHTEADVTGHYGPVEGGDTDVLYWHEVQIPMATMFRGRLYPMRYVDRQGRQ